MGTGIGEGIEGVQCGKQSHCLHARICYQETECDVGASTPGGSYHMQEIEGIGGVVKKKVKRRCRVGCVVKEYEDERVGRNGYLRREQEGTNRSWCSWCQRVVCSNRDMVLGEEDPLGRSFSSSDSSIDSL